MVIVHVVIWVVSLLLLVMSCWIVAIHYYLMAIEFRVVKKPTGNISGLPFVPWILMAVCGLLYWRFLSQDILGKPTLQWLLLGSGAFALLDWFSMWTVPNFIRIWSRGLPPN